MPPRAAASGLSGSSPTGDTDGATVWKNEVICRSCGHWKILNIDQVQPDPSSATHFLQFCCYCRDPSSPRPAECPCTGCEQERLHASQSAMGSLRRRVSRLGLGTFAEHQAEERATRSLIRRTASHLTLGIVPAVEKQSSPSFRDRIFGSQRHGGVGLGPARGGGPTSSGRSRSGVRDSLFKLFPRPNTGGRLASDASGAIHGGAEGSVLGSPRTSGALSGPVNTAISASTTAMASSGATQVAAAVSGQPPETGLSTTSLHDPASNTTAAFSGASRGDAATVEYSRVPESHEQISFTPPISTAVGLSKKKERQQQRKMNKKEKKGVMKAIHGPYSLDAAWWEWQPEVVPTEALAQHLSWMKIEKEKWVELPIFPTTQTLELRTASIGPYLVGVSHGALQLEKITRQFLEIGYATKDVLDKYVDDRLDYPQMFIHGAIALYLKVFRPTFKHLRKIALDKNVPIMERVFETMLEPAAKAEKQKPITFGGRPATISDLVLDVTQSMRSVAEIIWRLRKASFKAGFKSPNLTTTLYPTRPLQETLMHVALDEVASGADRSNLALLENVADNLGLRYFGRVSSTVVVDDRFYKDQFFPDMLFVCADQDQNAWVTGSTAPKCYDVWPEAHLFLEKAKLHQIGPKFLATYRRAQQELMLLERRIAVREFQKTDKRVGALTEQKFDEQEFRNVLHSSEFRVKVKREAIKQFQESMYFLGCKDSEALAIYKTGNPEPNCYRCRAMHAYNEWITFAQEKIDLHLSGYDSSSRYKKAHSCAECEVALQVATWRFMNGKQIWDPTCDPANWPQYDRERSSGLPPKVRNYFGGKTPPTRGSKIGSRPGSIVPTGTTSPESAASPEGPASLQSALASLESVTTPESAQDPTIKVYCFAQDITRSGLPRADDETAAYQPDDPFSSEDS